jgi:hypothetical protein
MTLTVKDASSEGDLPFSGNRWLKRRRAFPIPVVAVVVVVTVVVADPRRWVVAY